MVLWRLTAASSISTAMWTSLSVSSTTAQTSITKMALTTLR